MMAMTIVGAREHCEDGAGDDDDAGARIDDDKGLAACWLDRRKRRSTINSSFSFVHL
jgi:hypothetical protein